MALEIELTKLTKISQIIRTFAYIFQFKNSMKRKYTSLLALLFSILFHFSTKADNQVEWTASIENGEGGKTILEVTGTIAPGWNMYTTDMPAEGAEPLSFRIESIEGATQAGEFSVKGKCSKAYDNIFKMKLDRYTGTVTASIPLQATEGGYIKASGSVQYMASSDEGKFLPPTIAGFSAERGSKETGLPSTDSVSINTTVPSTDNEAPAEITNTNEEEPSDITPAENKNNSALMTYIGVLAIFTSLTFGLCIYLLTQVIKLKKQQ